MTVGSLDVESVETQTLIKRPIVNLSYFAIDSKYQRQGYGTSLMQEIFKSVSVISYYTGVELIYLESVDDSVCFYESLGFQLVRPSLRPENYQGISTENIQFPMYISIETLIDQGFVGYLHNFLIREKTTIYRLQVETMIEEWVVKKIATLLRIDGHGFQCLQFLD